MFEESLLAANDKDEERWVAQAVLTLSLVDVQTKVALKYVVVAVCMAGVVYSVVLLRPSGHVC